MPCAAVLNPSRAFDACSWLYIAASAAESNSAMGTVPFGIVLNLADAIADPIAALRLVVALFKQLHETLRHFLLGDRVRVA